MPTGSLSASWPACCAAWRNRFDERRKALRHAADDGERHRQTERAGANRRLRIAADRDPDRDLVRRARIDALVVQRRAVRPCQVTRSLSRIFSSSSSFSREQRVVVVEVVAEQRERLDERAAPGHDLGAAAGQQIEGGELLIDAHRIVRAQHRDGRAQAGSLGALGRRRQHDRSARSRENPAGDARRCRTLRGRPDRRARPLRSGRAAAARGSSDAPGRRVRGVFDERIDANFHGWAGIRLLGGTVPGLCKQCQRPRRRANISPASNRGKDKWASRAPSIATSIRPCRTTRRCCPISRSSGANSIVSRGINSLEIDQLSDQIAAHLAAGMARQGRLCRQPIAGELAAIRCSAAGRPEPRSSTASTACSLSTARTWRKRSASALND